MIKTRGRLQGEILLLQPEYQRTYAGLVSQKIIGDICDILLRSRYRYQYFLSV